MVNWYYVEGSERVGPVTEEDLGSLIMKGSLGSESYVWRKGFDNWVHLKNVDELTHLLDSDPVDEIPSLDLGDLKSGVDWDGINYDERIFMIKIGPDRGAPEAEYGPYSLNQLVRAFEENRINIKTFIFVHGMDNWTLLADLPIFQDVFQAPPPVIEESERRIDTRRPFVARLLFHNNSDVFEGICRDISVGGMQILVSNFNASVGDEVSLNVHPDNSNIKFTASGKIVRLLDGGQGFSIRFSELGDIAKRTIEQYTKDV
ncbi:type IV pilus assembly protein PilZ [Bacteriovorax sp. BSW11_IV]|uniref:GYF domain-containing protein n=1 Tax=Bacteriovorax sp. BSW11_IV TaxID=1353529 RepID=UPI000389F564|nr:GYF domain-containing protein [Bacteriovorax sp. BSW11_IV]EQC48195.1 type IV pilus assembly protein PilZ [Bacteriovorax sp. BSW11_IV]